MANFLFPCIALLDKLAQPFLGNPKQGWGGREILLLQALMVETRNRHLASLGPIS